MEALMTAKHAFTLPSLFVALAAGCSTPAAQPDPTGIGVIASAITGARPVVTLMMALPGPTAPESQQWTTTQQQARLVVPDYLTPGVDFDVQVAAVGGACSSMKSIV